MSIGIWQIVLILIIVLIIFGSGKLPKVMEDLAKGFKSFRDGMGNESEGSPRVESTMEILPPVKKSAPKKKPAPKKK